MVRLRTITAYKSWERTVAAESNKVRHPSTLESTLHRNIYIGIRNKNGLYVVHGYHNTPAIINHRTVANKPRGLQAARKLRNSRRDNRWVCFALGLPCIHISLTLFTNCGGTLILRI